MKIVIIGGTGHIGTYLVPGLVQEGHEIICVSRKKREPYRPDNAWKSVSHLQIDRDEEEKNHTFGKRIRDLNADIIIDLICFRPEQAKELVAMLYGRISHFLHCGTIWVHGYSCAVPTDESQPRAPFGEYGIQKAAIEAYLLKQYLENGFPLTILHPGHIVGPGWVPVNPAGNLDIDIFRKLAVGEEVILPNIGMETLHHVHASDVAQSFIKAIKNRDAAIGQSFHVVSPQALTMRGYAEALAAWFGQTANLRFMPWEKWKKTVSEKDAEITWDHIAHSPNCSIEKARTLIDYAPVYSSLEAVKESLFWLKAHDAR